MKSALSIGSYPFPSVCLNCGAWYDRGESSTCQSCGQPPDPATKAFYEWCFVVATRFEEHHFATTEHEKLRKALVDDSELRHGWSDTVLALISAIGLGILSNASYDIIKDWLLSRKEEFLKTRFVADYDLFVEIIVDYLQRHPHMVKEFEFNDEELRIKFNSSIKPLIMAVEQKAKIGEEPKHETTG